MAIKFTTNDLLAHMGTCDLCGCHSYALRRFGSDALCPKHWDKATLPRLTAIKEAMLKAKLHPAVPSGWECNDVDCHLLTA